MTDLSGLTALVTGASSGLGRHFAHLLAGRGARVLVAARRLDALQHLVETLDAGGAQARAIELDVTDSRSIQALSESLAEVDIVVNNAGVVRNAAALDQREDDWDAILDTNLKGMFFVAQTAAVAMRAHGRGGSIINVASILGLRQAGGVLPYAVSKAGVIQMTKILALELARYSIRVNALAPGYLDTELNHAFWETDAGKAMVRRIPQRRLGQLEDLDEPLLLLAGPGSAYMTGAVLAVDGGHLVSGL